MVLRPDHLAFADEDVGPSTRNENVVLACAVEEFAPASSNCALVTSSMSQFPRRAWRRQMGVRSNAFRWLRSLKCRLVVLITVNSGECCPRAPLGGVAADALSD